MIFYAVCSQDEIFGPVIICVLLFVAVLANFLIRGESTPSFPRKLH